MKNLFAVTVLSLFASISMAASPAVLSAVVKSKAIENVSNITKVEVVAVYRCPDCFDVVVTGTNPLGDAAVKVRTERTPRGALTVTYIEGTK